MTSKSASTLPTVGIYGLGIMGGIMAEALLDYGYKVCGFDIDAKAKNRFQKYGGQFLPQSSDVAARADILIVSVATAKALEQVTLAIVEGQKTRKSKTPPIVIETSTLTMADKNLFAKTLSSVGISALDCPISGTAVRMKDRAWTIFASGTKAAYKKALPVLEVFTDNVPYVGVFGNGTKLKFSANHLVAIYNVAYAESVALARKMGVDPREVLKLFGNSPVLGTGVMRLRMGMMVERKYTPPTMKVEVWQKDMEVIGQMAKSVDCPTPMFQTAASIYTAAMAQGLSQEDTASTAEVFAKMAGLP
jgi:3-hydroxyisobutyrate dehydrogenase-like beta-hydroxyacid dehydrogenase